MLCNEASIGGQVLDVGANIGYYTLLAAKLGQQVVAVEPVLDSIQRLHHAAHIEDVADRIKVIYNGIADVRTKATLRQSGHNQGDSRIELRVCWALHTHSTTVLHHFLALCCHLLANLDPWFHVTMLRWCKLPTLLISQLSSLWLSLLCYSLCYT